MGALVVCGCGSDAPAAPLVAGRIEALTIKNRPTIREGFSTSTSLVEKWRR
jgi:hypothetical protein